MFSPISKPVSHQIQPSNTLFCKFAKVRNEFGRVCWDIQEKTCSNHFFQARSGHCTIVLHSVWMRRRSKVIPREGSTCIEDNKLDTSDNDANDVTPNAQLSPQFMNHSDIKKRAIQVFYTEGNDRRPDFVSVHSFPCIKVLHPNGQFRSTFDFVTVIWVLVLVFMVPFQIGFDWYILSKFVKILMTLLDLWFAVDIILNFRTGYIHHGTIIMNPKKIVK